MPEKNYERLGSLGRKGRKAKKGKAEKFKFSERTKKERGGRFTGRTEKKKAIEQTKEERRRMLRTRGKKGKRIRVRVSPTESIKGRIAGEMAEDKKGAVLGKII